MSEGGSTLQQLFAVSTGTRYWQTDTETAGNRTVLHTRRTRKPVARWRYCVRVAAVHLECSANWQQRRDSILPTATLVFLLLLYTLTVSGYNISVWLPDVWCCHYSDCHFTMNKTRAMLPRKENRLLCKHSFRFVSRGRSEYDQIQDYKQCYCIETTFLNDYFPRQISD
jgi:hypothetical protein